DLLFLDLNMPEMDGYQVLQEIKNQHLNTIVIVVSGDIQPEAHKRVIMSGALEFIQKPVNKTTLEHVLLEKAVYEKLTSHEDISLSETQRDAYTEVINIALGQAADMLARVLNAFVVMPIPNVNMLEVSELSMTLAHVSTHNNFSAVCQGFIGSSIAGEALVLFSDSSIEDIADLMKFHGELTTQVELELLMDISSILTGACLQGIAKQLDISFSQSHPVILGRHIKMEDLFKRSETRWKKTLTVETEISIEGRRISCQLLLLFTEDSIPQLNHYIDYLIEN
ncbi:MAG: response regulator, partial [Thiohalomonadales bacterium]